MAQAIGRMRLWLFVLALILALPGVPGVQAQSEAEPEPIQFFQIGVLTTEGATRALEAWRPMAEHLNETAEIQELPYRFAVSPHSLSSLSEEISTGGVDFALTDPALFVAAEVESGARAILSGAHMWEAQTQDRTGALIFTRADRPMRDLRQLRGRSIMAVAANDFGGWWLAEQEFRRYRLEPEDMLGDLVFSGGNQREVVYAVQSGLVDAGVIRAGVLEALAAEGVIDLADFAPISAVSQPDYPFWVSTPLYPEWVFSALPTVPEPALAHVINTLLMVEPDHPISQAAGGAVWQAPQNYQEVHDLLISLRVRPYENYLYQAAVRIYRNYRWPIVGTVLLIVFSLSFLAFELRRNMKIAEAQRDVLQSEVRSKKFYRSAIEEHTVFCMLTLDGRISHVNDSFCETTARERPALLNTPLAELLPEKGQDVLRDEIMTSMDVGLSWSGPLQILKEDGSAAWAQCTVIPVSGTADELSEIAIVATDMTKTRQGISEERFNDSLELIEDQVVVMRPGTLEMLYCNRAASQKLVRDRMGGDWKGKSVKNFITESDLQALELRCDALMEGPQRRMTWEVTANNGTPYEISLEYVEPDHDEPRFIAIYRDITQRKVAEKAKNEFVSTVSHELRTPLTSMKGALGLALSGAIGEMPDKMNKMVSMASDNCDRLVMLINDILDLEKIEAGKMDFKMERLDMSALVKSAIEANNFYADKFGVSMRLQSVEVEDGYFTLGDKNRLMQVMDNLMSNASKFSPKGAEIIVSLRIANGRVRITIRDFGSGIPKSAQATIFDKFTQADSSDTRSKGGTGLGLSIAKMIVEEHKGAIYFVSEEEVGTEFFVDMPRMLGEELQSMEPLPEGLDVQFSPLGAVAAEESAEALEEASLGELIALLKKRELKADIEAGSVSASQLASGKGVVGQSTALNWLSDDSRQLLNTLIERGMLDGNRKVTVLQSKATAGTFDSAAAMMAAQTEVYGEWLGKTQASETGFSLIGVAKAAAPDLEGEALSLVNVADAAQALVMTGEDRYDAMLHFDQQGGASSLTVLPLAEGQLPASAPVLLMVAQSEAAEAERGVVSKFARPSGAGRGKARRRARS